MQLAAFHYMPIAYQGLVVESTSRCNARCAMCYQAAGPKGSDIIGDVSLTNTEIKKVIVEATSIRTLASRFHLSGGEAFLRVQDTIDLFREASIAGYSEISTTTNCYWAKNLERAIKLAARARLAGLTRMEISWDHWHEPFVSAAAVCNAIRACFESEIRVTLRLLTTRKHSVEEALAPIPDDILAMTSDVTVCPVFPTGRAATQIPSEEIFNSGNASGNCQSVLNLTVNARGNVSPCCAGADQTDALSFGNIRKESIADIAARMNRSDLLRALVFLGPQALLPIIEESHVSSGRYSNICHLCWTLFSNPVTATKIKTWFDERSAAFSKAAADLNAEFAKQ